MSRPIPRRLRLEWGVEPLSPLAERHRALEAPPPLKLARSAPLDSVVRDLKRYVRGEISGTSFLVSGHRGSGKTTLVHGALEEVLRWSMRQGLTRPLVVRINGPDLFRKTAPAEGEAEELPHTQVLKELAKSLARAVSDEYIASLHRNIDKRRDELGEVQFQRFRQMVVQLQLTLGGVVTLTEMEGLWRELDLLESGVVLSRDRRVGGGEEILTLWQTQEIYHQIAGKRTVSDRIDQKNEQKRTETTNLSLALDKVLPSFWALLTGSLAGAGLRLSGEDPLLAGTGALLTALLAAVTINLSSLRSFSIVRKREYLFEPDSGPRSLPRLLSRLVERLHRIGLAPVFVVDELDKVDGLDAGMHALIRQLKSFISERSCFFFLTEPGYFERLAQLSEGGEYPAAHTYFGRRVFVSYTPDDLRKWMGQLMPLAAAEVVADKILTRFQQVAAAVLPKHTAPTVDLSGVATEEVVERYVTALNPDNADVRSQLSQRLDHELSEVLQQQQRPHRAALDSWKHLLLYRSRQHFGDLARILRSLQNDDGTIAAPAAPTDRAFCRMLAQVGLEQAMIVVLGHYPERRWRQIGLDALYHPLGQWEAGGRVFDASQQGAREWAEKNGLSASAPRIIVRLRQAMADHLARPTSLQPTPGIRGNVSEQDALLVDLGDGRYRWRVTADGSPTPEEQAARITDNLGAERERIRGFVDALESWPGIDPVFLSEQVGLLPRRPDWSEVESALIAESPSKRERAVLTRFDAQLTERHTAIALALTWAAVLDPLQSASDFPRVLQVVNRAHRFEERSVEEIEDRLRLSRIRIQGWFPAEAAWDAVEALLEQSATLSSLSTPLVTLREDMQVWLDSLAEFSVEDTLWSEHRTRLEQYLERPGQPLAIPPMSWLICRLQRREAAYLLRLDPAEMSIREWSRAFLHSRAEPERIGWLSGMALRALRAPANIRDVVLVVRWKNHRIGSERPGAWPALVLEVDESMPAGALEGVPIRSWMLEVSAEESTTSIEQRRGRLVNTLTIQARGALFADIGQAPKGWAKMLLTTQLLMQPDSVAEAMEQWQAVVPG